jgi:hypothetical protein
MKQPSFEMAALTYPGAVSLDRQEFEGSYNVLLTTPDEVSKVWAWYARRLGVGPSPVSLGRRGLEAGVMQLASRRTSRVVGRQAPFSDSECPQALAVRQGAHAVTIVLSRAEEDGSTRVVIFALTGS